MVGALFTTWTVFVCVTLMVSTGALAEEKAPVKADNTCVKALKADEASPRLILDLRSNKALDIMAKVVRQINNETRAYFGQEPVDRLVPRSVLRHYVTKKNWRLDPSAQWESWKAAKQAEGWRYGAVENDKLKTHPSMTDSFEDLDLSEQIKNYMFYATLKSIQKYVKMQRPRVLRGQNLQGKELETQRISDAPRPYAEGAQLIIDMATIAHEINNDVRHHFGQIRSTMQGTKGGVEFNLNQPLNPEASWKSWKIDRGLHGWQYGPVYDDKRLIHPNIVENYSDLPQLEQVKDFVHWASINAVWFFWLQATE